MIGGLLVRARQSIGDSGLYFQVARNAANLVLSVRGLLVVP